MIDYEFNHHKVRLDFVGTADSGVSEQEIIAILKEKYLASIVDSHVQDHIPQVPSTENKGNEA